jgi:hypothetical protein
MAAAGIQLPWKPSGTHPVVEFDPGDGGRGEVLGVLDDHLSNFRATLDLARRPAPRVNGLTPGAAGAGLCGGGWAGPHRPTVTSTLRHVPAYRHGGRELPVVRWSRARPHVMLGRIKQRYVNRHRRLC